MACQNGNLGVGLMLARGDKIAIWAIVIGAVVALGAALIPIYERQIKDVSCDSFGFGCELKVQVSIGVYDAWTNTASELSGYYLPQNSFKCGDTTPPIPGVQAGKWYMEQAVHIAPDPSTPKPVYEAPKDGSPPPPGVVNPYADTSTLTRYLVWRLQLDLSPKDLQQPLTVTALYRLPAGSNPDHEEATITLDPAGQTQCEVVPFYQRVAAPGRYSLEVKVSNPRFSMGSSSGPIDVQP